MKTQESFGKLRWSLGGKCCLPSRPAHTLQSHLEKSVVTLSMSKTFPDLFQTSSLGPQTSPNRARKSIAHLWKAISVKRCQTVLTQIIQTCSAHMAHISTTVLWRHLCWEAQVQRAHSWRLVWIQRFLGLENVWKCHDCFTPRCIQTKKNDPTSTEMSWCACVMEPMTVSLSEVASIAWKQPRQISWDKNTQHSALVFAGTAGHGRITYRIQF